MNRIKIDRCILLLISAVFFSNIASAQDNSQDFVYPIAISAGENATFVADRRLPGIFSIADGNTSVLYKGSRQVKSPLSAVRCVAVDNDGSVLVGDSATRAVYRLNAEGALAEITKGKIGIPSGIAILDESTIVVTDLETGAVWKITDAAETSRIAVVPGATGVTIQSGNIIVLSRGANPVVKVGLDGNVTTIVSGRPFGLPLGIATLNDETLLVADGFKKTIWSVKSDGTFEKLASGEPFIHPVGITTSGDKILVVDSRAKAIFQIQSDGSIAALKN